MSTAAQLLAAVIAEPDEDTPRLAFADFLDENDRPERAELIRVQCELARLPDWELRAKHLRHRARVLIARHGREWRTELPTIAGVEWGRFHRGFVDTVRVAGPKPLLDSEPEIRAAAPVEGVEFTGGEWAFPGWSERLLWVRTIRLRNRSEFGADRFEALLNSGIAEYLRVLDLAGVGVENAGAGVIARCAALTNLEELDLTNGFVGVEGAEALAGAKHLANLRVARFSSFGSGYVEDPFLHTAGVEILTAADSELQNLRELELGQNELSAEVVAHLLTAPHLSRLEALSLRYCELDPGALAVPPGPARLQVLDIGGYRPNADSVRALAGLPQFASLVRLQADGCDLGAEDLAAIARGRCAGELRELYLADNGFGEAGAAALAVGEWPNLHTLDLRRDEITADGARALAAGAFPALAELKLGGNEIGDDGAKAVATAAWAGSLCRLGLSETRTGADGAAALAASPHLRHLTELDLGNNDLGPAGAAALARGPWAELADLHLGQTKAGDAGARALAAAAFAPTLLTLTLDDTGLTADGVRALAAADWASLRQLAIGRNPGVGAGGAEALAHPDRFPVLVVLNLMSCGLDAAALEAFATSDLVARLRRLNLYGNKTTPELHKRLGGLHWGDLGADWLDENSVREPAW